MDVSKTVDTALDRSIALGYGNVGLAVRRRLPDWPDDPPRMDGRVVIVTGAASGIGLAAARGFARLGATVRGVVRSADRADDLRRLVADDGPEVAERIRPIVADVSSLRSIRGLARQLEADHDRIDVLVNNAGVMPDERQTSEDGVELTFATHVLGPYVLVTELAGLLSKSDPGRVINVTSGGMYGQALPADDLETLGDDYGPKKVYARTKRAEMILTEQLADLYADSDIVVHAMHPGWADTKGVRQWLPVFRMLTRPIIRSPEEGADTIVWLGGAPEAARSTGRLWHDRRPRQTHLVDSTKESDDDRRALREALEAMASTEVGAGR